MVDSGGERFASLYRSIQGVFMGVSSYFRGISEDFREQGRSEKRLI